MAKLSLVFIFLGIFLAIGAQSRDYNNNRASLLIQDRRAPLAYESFQGGRTKDGFERHNGYVENHGGSNQRRPYGYDGFRRPSGNRRPGGFGGSLWSNEENNWTNVHPHRPHRPNRPYPDPGSDSPTAPTNDTTTPPTTLPETPTDPSPVTPPTTTPETPPTTGNDTGTGTATGPSNPAVP